MCMGWGMLLEGKKEHEREADATFSDRNLKVVFQRHEPSTVTSAWMELSDLAVHRSHVMDGKCFSQVLIPERKWEGP